MSGDAEMIRGIDHVALSVKDLNQALDFYIRIMGLKITDREYSKPGVEYFLDCGASLLGLIQGDARGPQHFFQHEGLGANHVAFRLQTSAFDAFVEKLKQNHVVIDFVKKREKSWSVYFRDPDGNKLEATAWPLESSTDMMK